MHVDDVMGGGDETFDRIMTAVRKEFWESGTLVIFDSRVVRSSQMPSGEIVLEQSFQQNRVEDNLHRQFKIC